MSQLRIVVALCICLMLIGCGAGPKPIGPPPCACPAPPPSMIVAERGANEVTISGSTPSTIPAPGAEALTVGQVTTSTGSVGVPILYVGEYPNSIAVLDSPYTKVNATITAQVNDPASIAATTINGLEALVVANRGANDVTIYENGNDQGVFDSPAVTLKGLNAPDGLAFDVQGNLWVAQGASVVEFTPPFTDSSAPVVTITNGLKSPSGIAFDFNGAMYVADKGNNAIVVYPAGSLSPSVTVTNGLSGPTNLLFYEFGLFVPNATGNTIAEFIPPLTSASVPSIDSGGMNEPSAITFLFVPQP